MVIATSTDTATLIKRFVRVQKIKIIVILGPTASGKSDLAVELAQKCAGEIISADSRQVYKGLDIGSGKITRKEMKGVPHHLLDVANPRGKNFTVADFKKLADKKIAEVLARGNMPILCGGTGFYIQSVVDDLVLPEVPPNKSLREKLGAQKTEKLFETLKKLDPKRAENIDAQNRPRLIRAIEIAKALGKVPDFSTVYSSKKSPYNILQIGIKISPEKLQKKIHNRLVSRMKKGMLGEARRLHRDGLSWKHMEELGLEYRYLALHLQEKISRIEMLEKIESESVKYAKRQMTWFKRDARIKWFALSEKKKVANVVRNFLLPKN